MKLKPRLILFISLGLLIGASFYAQGIPPSPPSSGTSPGGANGSVQCNSSGSFGACSNLTDIAPQASNANLTAIAGLTTADVSIIQWTGSGAASILTCTAANQLLGVNAANNALECKSTLSISALDLTSATSSIPFPVGTAAAPTDEGKAYWNSTTDTLTVGNGSTATDLMKTSGSQNLATTGTIQGGIIVSSDADGMTGAEMTAVGMYGTLFLATGAGTWTLPTAVSGMNVCLMDTGTAHDLILDVQAADTLMFNGTADTAGDGITNASGSSTGDKICVVAYGAGTWIVTSSQGTWVAQ